MKDLLFVFLGGGLGSVMRYVVRFVVPERLLAMVFPWSTFAVNVAGSFLIGLFYAISARFSMPDSVRLFLTVGLCGGFTTFSTFSNDTISLLRGGQYLLAAVYIVASVVLSLLAVVAGYSMAK